MTAEELQEPVRLSFNDFRDEYRRYTHSVAPLLHDVEEYLAQIPGKQLRPLILLLSAKACNTLTHSHILLATAIELLHNATLIPAEATNQYGTAGATKSLSFAATITSRKSCLSCIGSAVLMHPT